MIDIYDYMSPARLEVFKNVFEPYCVQRVKCDCVTESIEFPEDTFDVVTSFDRSSTGTAHPSQPCMR